MIEKVLAAAALPESATARGIAELGAAEVAALVLTEVAMLTGVLDGPADKVPVQWDLGFADERLGFIVTVGGDGASVEEGWLSGPDVVIRQDLTELVRVVYGESHDHIATREVFLNAPDGPPGSDPDGTLRRRREEAIAAARACTRAAAQSSADLTELAINAGTDKWGRHWYTSAYERHFRRFRDRPVTVLEIGCDGGESLRMWTHYFRRGRLVRVDAKVKQLVVPPRVRTAVGAQDDTAFLQSLVDEHGPFDIVIDDGSHLNPHVITSFTTLFPHLRPGGMYVIEDIGASYWPGWGGNSTDLNTPGTSIGFVKTLVDGLHHQQLVRDGVYTPTLTDRTVSGISLYHNIAFVEKGLNTERGAPAWVTNAKSALFL